MPPLNLVGDFGGGGMMLAFGVLAAVFEAQRSGKGQVVDAAMVDGAAYLAAMIYGFRSQGTWADTRGSNVLDTGAPWYDVYETSDGKWLAVGAIEARFYAEFLSGLGLDPKTLPKQHDRTGWPHLRETFAARIKSKPRDAWAEIFAVTDACVTPVLSLDEVALHPHMAARVTLETRDGVTAPAPAPRFSRTAPQSGAHATAPGADTKSILARFGYSPAAVAALKAAGAIGRDR